MSVTSLNVTEQPGVGLADVDICTLEINIKYEVIPAVVYCVCLTFGLIYSFFGYRCFKMVMFFSGFMSGSVVVLLLLFHKEPVLDAQLGPETKAGLGLGVGVLCGLMTMLVPAVGLALSGLQLGGLLSLAVLVVVGQFWSLAPAWLPLAAALATSAIAAVLTLQWQKPSTIVYTAVVGASAVMLCVDYLVGGFQLPDQVYALLSQAAPPPFCWFNWAVTGICPTWSLIGVLVQWRFTSKGVSHMEAAHKKQKKSTMRQSYRESRRGPGTHRRRRPPTLNRYAGDVLAPSYLRSLQERRMGTGSSSSSSLSTITHTLIDFDFETGSMVPLTAASPASEV